ncbi:hypothetical protein [Glycomyces luteolus]|uniref:hypothetical protein n=1 Tax=Glycomyces luteolus TaxID=2670330 RepID=UPI0038CBF5C0
MARAVVADPAEAGRRSFGLALLPGAEVFGRAFEGGFEAGSGLRGGNEPLPEVGVGAGLIDPRLLFPDSDGRLESVAQTQRQRVLQCASDLLVPVTDDGVEEAHHGRGDRILLVARVLNVDGRLDGAFRMGGGGVGRAVGEDGVDHDSALLVPHCDRQSYEIGDVHRDRPGTDPVDELRKVGFDIAALGFGKGLKYFAEEADFEVALVCSRLAVQVEPADLVIVGLADERCELRPRRSQ